jgi:hypothetical protein
MGLLSTHGLEILLADERRRPMTFRALSFSAYALILLHAAPQAAMGRDPWSRAWFEGLALGVNTLEDVQAKYGRPETVLLDYEGKTWLYYQDIGPVPGRVEIIGDRKTRIVESVTISPAQLSLAQVSQVYGPDHTTARYSFDSCLGDGESSPLFEDEKGTLEFVEFRKLGIAIRLNKAFVRGIDYLSAPLGVEKSVCQGSWKPAKFEGFIMGEAMKTEFIGRFGFPRAEVTDSLRGFVTMTYNDMPPLPGKAEVTVTPWDGVVTKVTLYPDKLTVDGAKQIIGGELTVVRYSRCPDEFGSEAIYESADGPLEFLVSRALGVAITQDGALVRAIRFLSEPLGPPLLSCYF